MDALCCFVACLFIRLILGRFVRLISSGGPTVAMPTPINTHHHTRWADVFGELIRSMIYATVGKSRVVRMPMMTTTNVGLICSVLFWFCSGSSPRDDRG